MPIGRVITAAWHSRSPYVCHLPPRRKNGGAKTTKSVPGSLLFFLEGVAGGRLCFSVDACCEPKIALSSKSTLLRISWVSGPDMTLMPAAKSAPWSQLCNAKVTKCQARMVSLIPGVRHVTFRVLRGANLANLGAPGGSTWAPWETPGRHLGAPLEHPPEHPPEHPGTP